MKIKRLTKGKSGMRFFLCLFSLILFGSKINAQTGLSCTTPILLGSGTSCDTQTTAQKETWYRFTADQTCVRLWVENDPDTLNGHAHKMELYAGNCSSLVLIKADEVEFESDSVLLIDTCGLTTGNDYWVKIYSGGILGCNRCTYSETAYSFCKASYPDPSVMLWNIESYEDCNLQYCMSSVRLNQRDSPLIHTGNAQPATLTVSCLPANFQMIKSYIYFVCVGNTPNAITFSMTGPSGAVYTVTANITNSGNGRDNSTATCWSRYDEITTAYRADITWTVAAEGNGNYILNGLPDNVTGSFNFHRKDTDGATILSIFKTNCVPGSHPAKIWLADGLSVTSGGFSVSALITGSSYNTNMNASVFGGIGDIEAASAGNHTTINGHQAPATFWLAFSYPTTLSGGATNYSIPIANNGTDCHALAFYGLYFQDATFCGPATAVNAGPIRSICSPNDTVHLHALVYSASPGQTYLWQPATGLSATNIANPIANPSVTTTYTLTVTTVLGCSTQDTVTIFVGTPPRAEIQGNEFADCSDAVGATFSNVECDPSVTYFWTFTDTNGTVAHDTGCVVNFNVGSSGGTVYLTALNHQTGCISYDTLYVAGCCYISNVFPLPPQINNQLVSDVLANPSYATYISGNTFTSGTVVINGQLTVDVPSFRFYNCNIAMGQNAQIIVQPGDTLVIDSTRWVSPCNIMWDGIYVQSDKSVLDVKRHSYIRFARNAIVSQKGGQFFIQDSKLDDNYRHVVVEAWANPLLCDVRSSLFTFSGSFLPAIPALPVSATRPDAAFLLDQVNQITIGNSGASNYRNTIEKCDFGIRAFKTNLTVVNNLFRQMPQNPSLPFSGVGIYCKATKTAPASLTLGGAGAAEPNTFQRYGMGVDLYNFVNLDAQFNTFDNSASNTGQVGIGVFNCMGRNILISHNSFSRHKTAVWARECLNANIDVNNNLIDAPSFGTTGTGIQVDAVLLQPVTLNISENTISRTRTGIWTNTITGTATQAQPSIRYNNVTMNFSDASVSGFGRHFGIRVTNCLNVDAEVNTVSRPTMPVAAMDTLLRGIHVEYATGTVVNSNTFRYMSDGIWMEQSNPGSQITCNMMDSCWIGVRLNNATIGNQFTNLPNDNLYAVNLAGPNSLNWDIKGSVPVVTNWYYRNTSANTLPSLFVTASFQAIVNNSSNSGCTPVPPPQARASGFSVPIASEPQLETADPDYNWWNTRNAYQHFQQRPQELTMNAPDDTLYQRFYSRTSSEPVAKATAIADSLSNGNLAAAIALNNTLPRGTTQDDLRRTVNEIYFSSWAIGQREFSSADSSTLYNIAFGNPASWGDAVFSARVMLGIDPTATFGSRLAPPVTSEPEATGADIYPQPADEQVTIRFDVAQNEKTTAVIYSAPGQLIRTLQLNEGTEHVIITSDLKPGVYLLRLTINGECRRTTRFVIVR